MKKILFPTAFSDNAPEVLKYASELAYQFHAELMVMHVFYNPKLKLEGKARQNEKTSEIAAQLVHFTTHNLLNEHRNIKIGYLAKVGLPTSTILDTAQEEEVDLIILSTVGKERQLSLGNTSLEVLAKADCPVLLVPPDTKFDGIGNLVYTTNFEFRDLGVINELLHWSGAFLSPLHILHVIENQEASNKAEKNMKILKETYHNQEWLRFKMMEGKLQQQIDQFATSVRADLVAMIAYKKSIFFPLLKQNRIKKIVSASAFPLLIFKDNTYETEHWTVDWQGYENV